MGIICKLEDDLIAPDRWQNLLNEMPKECQKVANKAPQGLGIGKNKKLGWFIMGSGQGPQLCWSEK